MLVSACQTWHSVQTHNGNLPTEVVLDLALLDSIWGVLVDDRGELWKTSVKSIHRHHLTMMLTFDTHVGDGLVKPLNVSKKNDLESGSGTRLRVRK